MSQDSTANTHPHGDQSRQWGQVGIPPPAQASKAKHKKQSHRLAHIKTYKKHKEKLNNKSHTIPLHSLFPAVVQPGPPLQQQPQESPTPMEVSQDLAHHLERPIPMELSDPMATPMEPYNSTNMRPPPEPPPGTPSALGPQPQPITAYTIQPPRPPPEPPPADMGTQNPSSAPTLISYTIQPQRPPPEPPPAARGIHNPSPAPAVPPSTHPRLFPWALQPGPPP
jgi:hypothetical protein